MPTKSVIGAAVAAVILALAGCETTPSEAPPGPPKYQLGYAAGCDSGYVAAGHPYYRFRKNHAFFNSDALYRQGWADGFAVCKGQYESIQRL